MRIDCHRRFRVRVGYHLKTSGSSQLLRRRCVPVCNLLIDAADNIVNFAADVQDAVLTCQKKESRRLRPYYDAVSGREHVPDAENTNRGANFLLVNRQGGSRGTTLAVDHIGMVRIGSSYVSPYKNDSMFPKDSAATTHTRRQEEQQELSGIVSEGSEDVLYYYIDADAPPQEDYGFELTGFE